MIFDKPLKATAILIAFLLLASCRPDTREIASPVMPVMPTFEADGLRIEVLSTKPWIITAGDTLVDVLLPDTASGGTLHITLNGNDVSASFREISGTGRARGLVAGLLQGNNLLQASLPELNLQTEITLTNYPAWGPIISGPHEQPFYCQTQQFQLVTGELLGPAIDNNCSVNTRIDYVYYSSVENTFKPYQSAITATEPADLARITTFDGTTVPFIVRVETGTINRAIYEIAMLHSPHQEAEPSPWNQSAGWNGKLVYTHGGGCRRGWYQQGIETGGVLQEGLLTMGYALVSSTLNRYGQNCNDLLASETHIMVKERFIEQYGEPIYTIATGSSGGSYQSHQTADNYPGVFDGIIVGSSFPDVTSATIFSMADARLLHHYFSETNPEGFTREQQLATAGFGIWDSLPTMAESAARIDPLYEFDTPLVEQGGEVDIPQLQSQLYSQENLQGVRATVYDHTVNVYGKVENSEIAARPLDNVGVQYGLAALNQGLITPQQFIDLNRDIGGFDRDLNHVPARHKADAVASKRAIESGRILYGGAGLAETPIIDYREYRDLNEGGDIHMIVHQYSTRQRLIIANGHANNHIMNIGGLWGYSAEEPDLGDLFVAMDNWLMNLKSDPSLSDKSMKVVSAKPASLVDNCWDDDTGERVNIKQRLDFDNNGRCGEIYPAYPTPRHVAGAPLANNIISCELKPVSPADYLVEFTDLELRELQRVFSGGVCDWTKPDTHGARHQGTWLSFGPSPVNRIQ